MDTQKPDLPITAEALSAFLHTLCPQWGRLSVHAFEFLPGGYSNFNYRVSLSRGDFVLRLPSTKRHDRMHWQNEHSLYQRLPSSIAAQPIAYDTATGVMLTQWLDGELIVEQEQAITDAQLLAYLSDLHQAIPNISTTYGIVDRILSDLAETGRHNMRPDDKLIHQWRALEDRHQSRRPGFTHVPCHNDLNPWNILTTADGWITLDWETAGLNDPLFDLATLHQGLERPMETFTGLAESWIQQAGTRVRGRAMLILQQFWWREYAWAIRQRSLGNLRSEIAEQIINAEHHLLQLSS